MRSGGGLLNSVQWAREPPVRVVLFPSLPLEILEARAIISIW